MFFGFRSFIHPSVCYQTCERDIMKTNKLILMPIGKSSPRVIDMKRSTLGVKRSKVKVTQGWRQTWKSGGGIILEALGRVAFRHTYTL